jgi:hypothetical protein
VTGVSKKRVVVLTVGLLGGGAAFAYNASTDLGPGGAGATTDTIVAVVVNQTRTVTSLDPGLPAQLLGGNFDNPNAGPVYVAAVTAIVAGTDKPGCGPADYTIAGIAPVNAEIATGNGVGAWTGLTIQFNNKPDKNQNACQNAVVTIHYSSS